MTIKEFEESKREALVRANAIFIENAGKPMNKYEEAAFCYGFAEGTRFGSRQAVREIAGVFRS